MKYLMAHDLGTSGNKATLFSENGSLVKSETKNYPCQYFHGNWAEQNPEDWWEAVILTTKNLLSGINPKDVAAISFSGQMMGCVCVDDSGKAIRPSLIWADQRAVKEEAMLRQKLGDEKVYAITGSRNAAGNGIHKLLWLKQNEPDTYRKTYCMLNCKDYIVMQLTGKFATDYSDASGTGALDLRRFDWSDEILQAMQLDRKKLPELVESSQVIGGVTREAASLTGLLEGTPVVCGGGDGSCATVGAGCIQEGDIYCSLGSSAWIAAASETLRLDPKMRIFHLAGLQKGTINPFGTMQAAGVSYAWMKDELCAAEAKKAAEENCSIYEVIEREVFDVPSGANGLIFLPYLLGERSPRWNPDAKGAFIGLRKEHTRADMLRAVLEGVSMNLRLILDVFQNQGSYSKMTLIGGGAKNAIWRQILSDVFEMKILRPNYLEEATSMGAAIAGGVGIGMFENYRAIDRFIAIENETTPIEAHSRVYRSMLPIFDECYASLAEIFQKLSILSR